MKKLKNQKILNVPEYKPFLKNNYLKKPKFQLKNSLFENPILYKNEKLELNTVDFNNYKTVQIPCALKNLSEISTINLKYKNTLLLSYDLPYEILYQFFNLIFQKRSSKYGDIIKGHVINGNWNNTKMYISILGFIFRIQPINLHNGFIRKNAKTLKCFNKRTKKVFYKKINSPELFEYFIFQPLNFIIISNGIQKELSRIEYVKKSIIAEQKAFNQDLINQKIHQENFKLVQIKLLKALDSKKINKRLIKYILKKNNISKKRLRKLLYNKN